MRIHLTSMFLAFSALAFPRAATSEKEMAPVSQTSTDPSSEVLSRILTLISESGTDSELSAGMAGAMGFTENSQPWPYRQIGARADESDSTTPLHIIAVHRGNDQDLLVYVWTDGVSHFIRTHRNLQVVKAISLDAAGEKSALIDIAAAQSEVSAELQFWDRNAEKTVHWWHCMGELAGAHPVTVAKKIEGCTWIIQSGKETPRAVATAYVNRSMAYQRDDSKKQLEDLNQAVKVDSTSANAWAQLCSAQNWVSDEKQLAIQSCSKAIILNPHSPEAWTSRGDIYLKGKEYDMAISDYDHAIKLVPEWMWPLDNRGEAYLRKNQIDRAIQDFNEVIRVSPDYAMGFLDRGIAQLRKSNLDAALTDFQTGIKVDPTCGACLFGQGLVKRAKGDQPGGDADIAKAKTLSPKAAEDFLENGITVP